MKSKSALIYSLLFVFSFGFLVSVDRVYGADPGTSSIIKGDGTDITGVGTTVVTPDSYSGSYGLASFRQFDLTDGDKAIMVLDNGTQYFISRLESGYSNPFNIYGTLESRIGSETGPIGGHLIFINPFGIHVGADASINTGSLTLTTANAYKIQDTSNALINVADSSSFTDVNFIATNFKDLKSSVIVYEDLASTANSVVVIEDNANINTLKVDGTDVEGRIDIVAGKIDVKDNARIGHNSTVPVFDPPHLSKVNKTSIVNLITAENATYNPATNTYTTDEIPNTKPNMGSINVGFGSQVLGNKITLKSAAHDPNAGMTGVAINIEGLVSASELSGNSGKVRLISESSNTGTEIRIAKTANGTKGVHAAGINADIGIVAHNINISDTTTEITEVVNSVNSLNMIAQNTITISDAGVTSDKINVTAGNELRLQNDAVMHSNKNMFIKTPLVNLDATNGIIKTLNGDIYIGQLPIGMNFYGYAPPPIPGPTLTVNIDGTTSKIDAAVGAGTIFVGSGNGLAPYNTITFNGAPYIFTDSILIENPSIPGIVAKKLNIFGPQPPPSDAISDNPNDINTVISSTPPPPPPPPPPGAIVPDSPVAPPPPPPPAPTNAPAYTEGGETTTTVAFEPDATEPLSGDQGTSSNSAYKTADQGATQQGSTEVADTNSETTTENTSDSSEGSSENNTEIVNNTENTPENNNNEALKLVQKYGITKIDKTNFKNYNGEKFVNSIATYSSADQEFSADKQGMERAQQTGYHGAGMAGYLLSVNELEKSPANQGQMNSLFKYRHPETVERLGKVKNEMTDKAQNGGLTGATNQQSFSNIQNLIH